MLNAILLLAILICTPCLVWAESNWDYAGRYTLKCSEGGQEQMNMCLEKEYQKIDSRLNALYKQLVNSLEDPQKLNKAQNAWIRYRNLDCEYATSGLVEDGSYYFYSQTACFIDHTEKRIRDFQRYLEWDGNGAPVRK